MKNRLFALLLSCVLCLGMVPAAQAVVSNDPVNGPQVEVPAEPEPPTPPTPSTPDTPSQPSYPSGGGSSSSDRDDPPSKGYLVAVPSRNPDGAVRVNPSHAEEGETVTITVTPNKGYELESLTVTDSKDNQIRLTDLGGGKYSFTMPASQVTVVASFAPVAPKEKETRALFTDVQPGAYYYDAVAWAVEQGITAGTTATTFSPDASCTRAQTVTFLWRAAGSPAPQSTENPFTDVRAGAYYYSAVLWAVEQGMTTGTTATTFSPGSSCTRAQIVTFLYRDRVN